MDQPPYGMGRSRRETVLAAHVRTNRSHCGGSGPPVLCQPLPESEGTGGTRSKAVGPAWEHAVAIRYVVDEQGDPMAVFEASEPRR